MARLFTSGAETGATEWNGGDVGPGNPNVASSTSVKRTGDRAWYLTATGTSDPCYFRHVFDANETQLYGRFALYVLTNASGRDFRLLGFHDNDNGRQFYIRYDSGTSTLEWRDGGNNLLANGNVVIPVTTWVVVEFYVNVNASGTLTIKINGTTDATFSGDTDYTNIGDVRSVYFGLVALTGVVTGQLELYLDDIGINNASGTYQNSWLGLGGVFYLEPTADGTTTDWTPSAGTVNYAMVDDIPPDNATTYVQALTTSERDLYVIDDCPQYVNTINLVEVVYRAAVAESGYNYLRDVVYVAGTAYTGLTNTIVPITPSFTYYHGTVHYINPNTGTAWGTVEVNAMEAGIEVA